MKVAAPNDLKAAIAHGYRLTTSREITPDRSAELTALYQKIATSPDALTVVASVLLNLDEALTR
jgi:hypothetical protein